MVSGVEAFQAAMTGDSAPVGLASNCRWLVNGEDVGACAPAFGSAPLAAIAQIRDREVLVVDEERGLVVARLFEDLPAIGGAEGIYPKAQQVVAVFRFVNGRIEQVHAFTSELPFGMKPHR